MKVLVLGASGATGSLVVQQLLNRNIGVRIVVRDIKKVPGDYLSNGYLEYVVGSISEFEPGKYSDLIKDCDAVVSCLGHNISFRGLYGKPRMLVSDTVKKVCNAITESKNERVKLILMNTTGNMNRKISEKYSEADKIVISMLNILLPPQKDNVEAAKYLSNHLGETNSKIEWVAVRPDTLINEESESKYEILESIERSPIFDAGKTSRINVGCFMVELLLDENLWKKWKFKMPVIYNR